MTFYIMWLIPAIIMSLRTFFMYKRTEELTVMDISIFVGSLLPVFNWFVCVICGINFLVENHNTTVYRKRN